MRDYLLEFKTHWRALLSASLGLAAGTISNYINNLFSPSLIEEFGWPRSEFALIGLTVVIAAVCLPFAGRIVDRLGTRRMALIGVAGLPLLFVGLSLQNGDFRLFFALSLLQMLFVSCIAGILVYTRLVARNFTLARGVALGIASCAPAFATAFFSPLLSDFIATEGWRAGYLAMAVFTAVFGAAAILFMPPGSDDQTVVATGGAAPAARYLHVLKAPALLLIFVAILLCNLHFTILTTQIKVVVLDRGVTPETGSLLVSAFAVGAIIGRLACGLALDRFSTHLVAFVSFAIPGLSLAVLASGAPEVLLIGAAVLGLGLAMGAEGDLVVYLAAKYFPRELFSSVLSVFTAGMAISASLGALILSLTLDRTGGYTLFLSMTAVSLMVGALSFLLLPRLAAPQAVAEHALASSEPGGAS
ncbi:MAG: MFS transporter [Alphaproteobacteria bacterium]|nr:MAG: MFS transporter [Alphaproteobacteria bacterium]